MNSKQRPKRAAAAAAAAKIQTQEKSLIERKAGSARLMIGPSNGRVVSGTAEAANQTGREENEGWSSLAFNRNFHRWRFA